MTCTRVLTVDHFCWGVAFHSASRRLFISDGGKTVYMYDLMGEKLRTISADASGRNLFQLTRHIAISEARDRVYVADSKSSLVTLDIDGTHLFSLSGKDIQATSACGVCTDGRNVFVSDSSSGNIVQIGQNNIPLGKIANIKSPVSLCFDANRKKLYVTTCGYNITVLELE